MSNTASWLQKHGLGKYATLFADHEIELGDLKFFAEEDLEKLGLPLGPRKRLLGAVLEDPPVTVPLSEEPPLPDASTVGAERRQLTVMFCDLVGSVELGRDMDLEDYRELLREFRAACVRAIEQYDGFVARHQGDGVLVYFGYPMAREDDALRAVHAGLSMLSAVGAIDAPAELRLRIGIATGPAIVGDILSTGSSDQSELAALGTTPNLAARLQGFAEPNEVLVSETTRQVCGAAFEFESRTLPAKGFSEPVQAHRVRPRSRSAGRADITSGRQLTPLIGREEELALLGKRWSQAQQGHGQVALISAEPGVGKTRLMMEVHRRFVDDDAEAIVWFCSAYHSASALYPFIEYIDRTLRLGELENDAARLAALKQWVDSSEVTPEAALALLAPLLSVPLPGKYRPIETHGDEQRRRLLEILSRLILARSTAKPLLIAVEDAHWIDPTTEELLGQLIDSIRERRVLLLLTFRPEYTPPWNRYAHLTTLTLNHLTGAECEALIGSLNKDGLLSPDVVGQIVTRTDGVPLFIEELSRAVRESGQDEQRTVPETLRDALTARLDRLGDSKRVAQVAAVIGRTFPWWLLEAASAEEPASLRSGLERLVKSELAYRRTLAGEEHYAFKHALVRDCAYQSLLRDECRHLHRKVAQALEQAPPGANPPPELIARHFSDAAVPAKARPYWQEAGDAAQRKGAFNEALGHFEAATRCLEDGSNEPDSTIELSLRRAECLHFLARREQALEVLERHQHLVEKITDARLAGVFYVSLGRIQAFQGLREQALMNLEKALENAKRSNDVLTAGIALAWIARNQVMTGQPNQAHANFEESLKLLRPLGPSWELGEVYFRFGMFLNHYGEFDFGLALDIALRLDELAELMHDPRIRCNAAQVRGHALLRRGDWDEAESCLARAIELAPNAYERTFGLGFLAPLYLEKNEPERALPLLEEALASPGYRSREVECRFRAYLAEAKWGLGELDEARDLARASLELANELQYVAGRRHATSIVAGIDLEEDHLEAANAGYVASLDIARRSEDRYHQAFSELGLAKVAHRRGDAKAASDYLTRACRGFESIGAGKQVENVRTLGDEWHIELPV